MINDVSTLISDIKNKLKKTISQKRYNHILGVEETSCLIGNHYNLDINKLKISALLHDYAKELTHNRMIQICKNKKLFITDLESKSVGLLHAKISTLLAQEEFAINDSDILNAINNHTTGRIGMNIYEEIIFVSDYCEPSRNHSHSKALIELALNHLSQAVYEVLGEKIIYVITHNELIHPLSVEVYNYYNKIVNDS